MDVAAIEDEVMLLKDRVSTTSFLDTSVLSCEKVFALSAAPVVTIRWGRKFGSASTATRSSSSILVRSRTGENWVMAMAAIARCAMSVLVGGRWLRYEYEGEEIE